MKRTLLFLFPALLFASMAQSQTVPPVQPSPGQTSSDSAIATAAKAAKKAKKEEVAYKPFSQIGIGAGFSLMGINLQAATNLNRYLNVRGSGNVINYNRNNIDANGFNVDARLNMASAGASLDYYPFPTHGLRLSPGLLFFNHNTVGADVTASGGTSFKLNGNQYYSSASNPVRGTAAIGFNARNPAFTITTGWGNPISRKGSRVSFPFELGAAFVGTPTLNAALTQGQVCDAQGANCLDVATDATVQSDLQAEVAKYKKDLDPLKVYPIISFGISVRFGVRN